MKTGVHTPWEEVRAQVVIGRGYMDAPVCGELSSLGLLFDDLEKNWRGGRAALQ